MLGDDCGIPKSSWHCPPLSQQWNGGEWVYFLLLWPISFCVCFGCEDAFIQRCQDNLFNFWYLNFVSDLSITYITSREVVPPRFSEWIHFLLYGILLGDQIDCSFPLCSVSVFLMHLYLPTLHKMYVLFLIAHCIFFLDMPGWSSDGGMCHNKGE